MSCPIYRFDLIAGEGRSYYFQKVKNRRLTRIPHSHDFYEVIYFQRGGGEKLVCGTPLTAREGDLLILRPGDAHYFLSQTDRVAVLSASVRSEEFRRICSVFSAELCDAIDSAATPPLVHGATALSAAGYGGRSSADEREEKLWLCEALKVYLDLSDRDDGDGLLAAMERMRSDEHLRCGLPALERESGYSRSHLTRLFRERYGTSPKRYINELRLERARELLISTDIQISEVAEAVGFLSESHFSKVFRERYGIPPATLRRTAHLL